MRGVLLTFMCSVCVAGCAASPEGEAGASGPGPMRPRAPDEALAGSQGVALDEDVAVSAWVAARVEAARVGRAERVRVPLAAAPPFTEGSPPFGLASGWPFSEARAVTIVDLTSIGIQPGPDGWRGWVEGRFTGERDSAGRAILEVRAQASRRPDEAPLYRVVE